MYYFAYTSKTTSPAKLKFERNVGAYECFMQIAFGSARSRDQNLLGGKWAKSLEFEPKYLGNYRY